MQSREVYIKFTQAGSAVTIPLNDNQIKQAGSFKRMIFGNLTFPTTYYAISSINNTFVLYERGTDMTELTHVLSLNPGNYTAASFAAALQDCLNYAGGSGGFGAEYSVEVGINSGKLHITYSGDDLGGFKIGFYYNSQNTDNIPSKRVQAEKFWGIPPTSLSATPPVLPQIGGNSYLTSYLSSFPVQLWGPDQLLLVSSTFQNMITRKNIDIGDSQPNIIMRLPVIVSTFAQQTTEQPANEVTTTASQSLPSSISIGITDESGNYLNFNGGMCYFILTLSN